MWLNDGNWYGNESIMGFIFFKYVFGEIGDWGKQPMEVDLVSWHAVA